MGQAPDLWKLGSYGNHHHAVGVFQGLGAQGAVAGTATAWTRGGRSRRGRGIPVARGMGQAPDLRALGTHDVFGLTPRFEAAGPEDNELLKPSVNPRTHRCGDVRRGAKSGGRGANRGIRPAVTPAVDARQAVDHPSGGRGPDTGRKSAEA